MISDQRIQRNVQSLRCGRKWFNWCWGAGKVDTSAGVSWYLVSNNIYHVFNWKLLQFKFVFNWTCICAWLSWYQYSLNIICPLINMCPIVTFQICALLDLYSIDGEEVGRLIHVLLWSERIEGISATLQTFFVELSLQESANVLLKSDLMQKRQALTLFKNNNVYISQILLLFASMFAFRYPNASEEKLRQMSTEWLDSGVGLH